MKTNLFALILLFIATCSVGQIRYEKGYYIDNDNQKTECLIKNVDWNNNPNEFIFKQNDFSIPEKGNILSIKEFGIYGFSKFIRADIKIDRSSNDIARLTYEKNPIWSQEQLFLKVAIEGKASLYYYKDGNLIRFFYSVADTSINQLIFKKYLVNNLSLSYNNKFRQQLWVDVRCANTSMNSLENINYTQKDLEKYFTNYNSSLRDTIIERDNKPIRNIYNLKIAPGFNLSSMLINGINIRDSKGLAFKNNFSIHLGIESEFFLPYNKNKWGILIEPTFQYFNSKKEFNTDTATIEFSSIEFPVGLRYYLYLNNELKVFSNCHFISNFSLNFNSKIIFNNTPALDVLTRNSFALGGGIEYKKISVEFRYYTYRKLLSDFITSWAKYNRFSVIFGYKLIKTNA